MHTAVSIPGIHCDSCIALIKDVSTDHSAIKSIDISLDSKVVKLEHDDTFDMHKWVEDVEALSDQYKVHHVS